MKTELKKQFSHGFSLSEQELRRIHNTMTQQMKIKSKNAINSFFEIKHKNGVRSEKATLDDIIAENNSGGWEIQELKMNLVSRSNLIKTKIEIEFRIPPPPPTKEATQRPYAIQYYVVGDERDWVYLTSSQLDDRIAKIKEGSLFSFMLYFTAISIALFIVSIIILSSTRVSPTTKFPLGYKIAGLFVSTLLIICSLAFQYGFSSHNFCWGDYLEIYNNRRTKAKYVINGMIISLILGIIATIITNLFYLK